MLDDGKTVLIWYTDTSAGSSEESRGIAAGGNKLNETALKFCSAI
jgi:hypothetical protein